MNWHVYKRCVHQEENSKLVYTFYLIIQIIRSETIWMSVHLHPGCETCIEIWPTAVAGSWKTSKSPPRLVHLKIPALKLTRQLEIHSWKFGDSCWKPSFLGCYDMLVYWSVKISKNHPFLYKKVSIIFHLQLLGSTWFNMSRVYLVPTWWWKHQPFWNICASQVGSWNPKHSGWTFQNIFELPWHHHLHLFSFPNLSQFFNQTPACF